MEGYRSNYGPHQPFEKKEINLLDYWRVLWKRKWMIAAFALVVFATVTIKSFLETPVYTTKGTLLIEKEPNILTFEEIFQIETFRDDYYQTQYRLLQSRSLAERAVERLGLFERAAARAKNDKGGALVDRNDPRFRRSLVNSFLGRLEVKPVRMTRLVEVQFKDPDPKFAAEAVNTLFDSFIDMNIETRYEATEQAIEFLTNQIATLRAEVDRQERELQAYGAEKNIIALSDKETTIIERLADVNKALTDAKIDRVRKEAYYNEIKIASPEYIPESMANPLIQRLREDYVRLNREYMKKSEMFKPDYPEMQRIRTDLENAKKALENETRGFTKAAYSEYQAALKKEKSFEEVFNKQKEEAIQLGSNAIVYNSLKIEVENKKNLLDTLLRRQSETGVAARMRGLRTANVRVVDRAEAPASPSSPRKKMNMLLALLVGLFGGIGLAFLFEHLDNSVKTSEDVEKYAGLPALGVVPVFSEDGFKKGYGYGYGYGHRRRKRKEAGGEKAAVSSEGKGVSGEQAAGDDVQGTGPGEAKIRGIELINYFSPKSNFSESYRSVRTALLLSPTDPNLKSIVISSPLPAEGKTATVANLAVALAQADKKVLIIDSDLRKPRLHRIFKVKNLNGLTNFLTADIDMKDLVKTTHIPNLFLINAGPVPPNPAELLGSEKMAELVGKMKEHFHYILFDSPPVLAVSDAMVMGPVIDGMILIVWGGKTSREALKRAKEHLDMVNIKTLGVIINRINMPEHDYYYRDLYYMDYYREQRYK